MDCPLDPYRSERVPAIPPLVEERPDAFAVVVLDLTLPHRPHQRLQRRGGRRPDGGGAHRVPAETWRPEQLVQRVRQLMADADVVPAGPS
jgi:hypothetical protein